MAAALPVGERAMEGEAEADTMPERGIGGRAVVGEGFEPGVGVVTGRGGWPIGVS